MIAEHRVFALHVAYPEQTWVHLQYPYGSPSLPGAISGTEPGTQVTTEYCWVLSKPPPQKWRMI